MGTPNDITPVQATDLISQFPPQFQNIIRQIVSNCAATAFPVTDTLPGRLAFILNDPDSPSYYRGWICFYAGLNPDNSPNWVRLIHTLSPPPTGADFQALIDAVAAKITGAATTIAYSDLAAGRVVVSDSAGKVGYSAITATTLLQALSGYDSSKGSLQAQLNAKQNAIIASTAAPTPADAVGKPDGTIWLTYSPT